MVAPRRPPPGILIAINTLVSPSDVLYIFRLLTSHDIPFWLGGGWGIDALLGEQTRPHKDVDMLVLLQDVPRLLKLMEGEGWRLAHIWEENRWATGKDGSPVATAFILEDTEGRQIDAHALVLDEQGNATPAWLMPEGFHFEKSELEGAGMIAGVPVPCITAEKQVRLHAGYALPEAHWNDLQRLHARLGVELPDGLVRKAGE